MTHETDDVRSINLKEDEIVSVKEDDKAWKEVVRGWGDYSRRSGKVEAFLAVKMLLAR
jgi:hypothetical protein